MSEAAEWETAEWETVVTWSDADGGWATVYTAQREGKTLKPVVL